MMTSWHAVCKLQFACKSSGRAEYQYLGRQGLLDPFISRLLLIYTPQYNVSWITTEYAAL